MPDLSVLADNLVSGAVAGGLVGALIMRFLDRKKSKAEVNQLKAVTAQDKAETQAIQVGVLKEIIEEVREDSKNKSLQIIQLSTQLNYMTQRIDQLEERERHNLTRVAVHEAWDELAYSLLLEHHKEHPPPPPLRSSEFQENSNQLKFGD